MSLREATANPPDYPLTFRYSSDDSKSSSPEPVTHLKWDDPYYDIARHQIVEVAGEHTQHCIFYLLAGLHSWLPEASPSCHRGRSRRGQGQERRGAGMDSVVSPLILGLLSTIFKNHRLDCDDCLVSSSATTS